MTLPTNNAEHEVAGAVAQLRAAVGALQRHLPLAALREFIRDVTVQLDQTINEQVDLVVNARKRLPRVAGENAR